jgi:hypothetical protein
MQDASLGTSASRTVRYNLRKNPRNNIDIHRDEVAQVASPSPFAHTRQILLMLGWYRLRIWLVYSGTDPLDVSFLMSLICCRPYFWISPY